MYQDTIKHFATLAEKKSRLLWQSPLAFAISAMKAGAYMTLLSVAWLGPVHESITTGGLWHNLLWVTVGNIIGGSISVGVGYWLATPSPQPSPP